MNIAPLFYFAAFLISSSAMASDTWIFLGPGVKVGHLRESVASTFTDLKIKSIEPEVRLAAEHLAQIWGKKVILGISGNFGQAFLEGESGLSLRDEKFIQYDISGEIKTSLWEWDRTNIIFLLGAQYASLPGLVRPAVVTGQFSFENISTLSATAGLGTVFYFSGNFLRAYGRLGLPISSSAALDSGSGLSLQAEFGGNWGDKSTWIIQGTGTISTLSYHRVDPLTGLNLGHERSFNTVGIAAIYSYHY